MKKGVDFCRAVWYSNQAVRHKAAARETLKIRQKNLKKSVDKPKTLWYSKCHRRERRVPCKLNNVTKRKHQTDASFVRNHRRRTKEPTDRVESITGHEGKHEAMENSSMKD